MNKKKKALTWEDLANYYDKFTGGTARTRPMHKVFEWAEKQTDKFYVDDKGYIYKK